MNSIQKAWIAIGVFVLLAVGLLFWQAKYNKPKGVVTSLTKEDVETLLKDFPPQQLKKFAESKEERQNIIKQLKELLALAAEARAMGLDKTPEMKSQLDLTKSVALMQAYNAKMQKENPAAVEFKKEEIDAFWKKPGIEEKFKSFVAEAQKSGQLPAGEMQEAQMTQLKEQWARVFIAEEKAIQAGLDKDRKTELQIAIQQALTLARKYNEVKAEENKTLFEVKDSDVDAWLAAHPELDTKTKRAKAEDLLKRARAGEDFAKLANENTDDTGNKDEEGQPKGGFYEFGRGMMDKNFEAASFALQPGQVSDIVETPYGYHIIKLEGKEKKKNAEGKEEEQVKVRHILISTMVKDENNPMGRELPLREKAKQELEKEKREKFINQIAAKHHIELPDDFSVVVPPMPPQQQQQQLPPEMQQQPGEEEPAPSKPEPKKTEGKKPAETKPKKGK